jgi:hypothetical protein
VWGRGAVETKSLALSVPGEDLGCAGQSVNKSREQES